MILRVVSGVCAAVFGFSAAVQWNDPDPLPWIVGYGAVAVVSAAVAFGARPRWTSVAVLVPVLGAFLWWAPAFQHFSLDALGSFGMSGAASEEEVREAIGLGLAAVWMAVLVLRLSRPVGR